MADIKAELNGISVSFNKDVVAAMTEKEFTETFMADEAVFAGSSEADKKRALQTVYRACNPVQPKKEKAEKPKEE